MIPMFMGIEDLGNFKTFFFSSTKTTVHIQRINN